MAALRAAGIAFTAVFLLQTLAPGARVAFGGEAPDGHDARTDPAARSIDLAVATGEFKQAAALLARGASAGSADAQYQLASLYRLGRGVPQDEALAFKWMKAAAEQGHVRAEFNLGTMYLAGRGVDRDIGRARTWLLKAAAQGYREASFALAGFATGPSRQAAGSKSAAPATRGTPGARPQKTAPPTRVVAENGRPMILDAALRGQSDVILKLISNGADIAARDAEGNTALALAAAAGQVEAMNVVLSSGASADTKNKAGETPLMLAAAKGHAAVVARLLEAGEGVTAVSPSGADALSAAVRGCHGPVIQALISHGADPKEVLNDGTSLLMLGAASCDAPIVQLLLNGGPRSTPPIKTGIRHFGSRQAAAIPRACQRCSPWRRTKASPTGTVSRRCKRPLMADRARRRRFC